jgi:hypothetical protein
MKKILTMILLVLCLTLTGCKDKVSSVEDLLLNASRYNLIVSFLNCLNSNGIYFNEEVQNFPKQFREKVQQEKTYLDFVWSTKF